MYAAYSAAFSRMLSDSTPGRASAAPGAAGRRFLVGHGQTNSVAVVDQQRLGDEPRLQRMARRSARCSQQRPMIAKQRDRRHRRRERRERRGEVGIALRHAAGDHPREVRASTRRASRWRAPSRSRRSSLAPVLDPRRERDRRQRSRLARAPRATRRARPATPGSASASAASGAPPACASTAAGSATPCACEPRASPASATGAAPPGAGSGCAASAAGGPADATRACRYVAGGGSSSVFSSAFAAAALQRLRGNDRRRPWRRRGDW